MEGRQRKGRKEGWQLACWGLSQSESPPGHWGLLRGPQENVCSGFRRMLWEGGAAPRLTGAHV